MIQIEEIPLKEIGAFWERHLRYLEEEDLLSDEEERAWFSGRQYRGILEEHMVRDKDRQHMVYFVQNGERIGAASYCTYQSEDGKCFILDFWVFPPFRGNGTGHRCFEALARHTTEDGALYYALNSTKEDSIRFWESLGFVLQGSDEQGLPLLVRHQGAVPCLDSGPSSK